MDIFKIYVFYNIEMIWIILDELFYDMHLIYFYTKKNDMDIINKY